METSHRRSS